MQPAPKPDMQPQTALTPASVEDALDHIASVVDDHRDASPEVAVAALQALERAAGIDELVHMLIIDQLADPNQSDEENAGALALIVFGMTLAGLARSGQAACAGQPDQLMPAKDDTPLAPVVGRPSGMIRAPHVQRAVKRMGQIVDRAGAQTDRQHRRSLELLFRRLGVDPKVESALRRALTGERPTHPFDGVMSAGYGCTLFGFIVALLCVAEHAAAAQSQPAK